MLDTSFLKYRASEIAASSLILAAKALKKPSHIWNKEMEKSTGIPNEHLQPIVEDVRDFILEVNTKFLNTLKYKFSKAEYLEVAGIPFIF